MLLFHYLLLIIDAFNLQFLLVIFPAAFQGNPCFSSTGKFHNNYNCIHAYGITGILPVGSNPRFRTIGKSFRYYW